MSARKARLPLKSGGLGHTSAVLLSPIAFYAAYSQHAFLDEGTRTRLLERELVPTAAVLRDVLPPVGLELVVPIADLGAVKPPRKLQRDLTRAAHALVFQRLKDSPHCVRDTRVLAHPTDAFLPFLAAPTSAALLVEPPHFTAGLRSYLLLPQLLRLSTPPVLVDPPASSDAPDFSYEADACRHCPGRVCDRHLAHAHACRFSSNKKIRDRHELVKAVRVDAIRTAGYDDIKVEPRLTTASQRRADIFYVDRSSHKHIHYYTDDVVCHPLCESHIEGEVLDPLSTLRKVEGVKAASYAHVLDGARSAAAVSAGLRVITYHLLLHLSGRPWYGHGQVSYAAAGYLKKRAVAVARTALGMMVSPPRDFLHCFGSASAVNYRLQSCVATD